jgi:hypothetical protein
MFCERDLTDFFLVPGLFSCEGNSWENPGGQGGGGKGVMRQGRDDHSLQRTELMHARECGKCQDHLWGPRR